MGQTKTIIKELQKFKRSLSRKMNVQQMVLYGSRARGDHLKESDVDVILVSKGFIQVPFVERIYNTTKHWKHDLPLEIFCYTPEEFELKKKESRYMQKILSEGIAI